MAFVDVFWSPDNRAVSGNLSAGDIGTSFYRNRQIYLLGDANSDTDEYDDHIVVHEFIHYVTGAINRDDSLGGLHTLRDYLDETVAYSEGMANALSGLLLDDAIYKDSGGPQQQAVQVAFNLENTGFVSNDGPWSEASTIELFYDLFDGGVADDDSLDIPLTELVDAWDAQVTDPGFTTVASWSFALLNQLSPLQQQAVINRADLENIELVIGDRFSAWPDGRYIAIADGQVVNRDFNGDILATSGVFGQVTNNFFENNKYLHQQWFRTTMPSNGQLTIRASSTSQVGLSLRFSGDLGGGSFETRFAGVELQHTIRATAGREIVFAIGTLGSSAPIVVALNTAPVVTGTSQVEESSEEVLKA